MAITFRDIFSTSDLSTFGTPLTTGDIVRSILVSFLTGLFIFYIYRKTYSGVLYSKNFNIALIMATMVASVIMMAIGGNLALALGMVGALSIIRFRTPIKDPKDTTYLFWAVTAGIVNGIQFYKLSLISSAMLGFFLFILSKKLVINKPFIMILKDSNIDQKKLNSVLKKYCSKFEIRNATMEGPEDRERTIEIKIKEDHIDQLLKELKETKGIKKVMIFSHSGELSE